MCIRDRGAANHIRFAEDMGGHQSTKKNREAVNVFFMEFLNLPGDPTDHEVDLFSEEELRVTASGQVNSSLGSKTIFDLNREYLTAGELTEMCIRDSIRKTDSGAKPINAQSST